MKPSFVPARRPNTPLRPGPAPSLVPGLWHSAHCWKAMPPAAASCACALARDRASDVVTNRMRMTEPCRDEAAMVPTKASGANEGWTSPCRAVGMNRGRDNGDAMHAHTLIAFTAVAAVAILSPGPATLLALRNSMAWGPRTAVWSTLGNVCGLFCLSAGAMLGLGVVLQSSAVLFGVVKLLGAGYLFYVGFRQLTGRGVTLVAAQG